MNHRERFPVPNSFLPMVKSGGGYIMSLDHRVVRGTSLDDFRYYVGRAREPAAGS